MPLKGYAEINGKKYQVNMLRSAIIKREYAGEEDAKMNKHSRLTEMFGNNEDIGKILYDAAQKDEIQKKIIEIKKMKETIEKHNSDNANLSDWHQTIATFTKNHKEKESMKDKINEARLSYKRMKRKLNNIALMN